MLQAWRALGEVKRATIAENVNCALLRTLPSQSPRAVWSVPLLCALRVAMPFGSILKQTHFLRQKSPHNKPNPMRTLLPVANELQARLEASVQTHASIRRPARVTRRSLRGALAGGAAVRFARTGTLSPPSLHGLAMRRG